MRIKHKNMKDVCAEILEDRTEEGDPFHSFKVLWINLLGSYNHPKPFPIGSSSRLAIETIQIPKVTFHSEWKELPEL